jgi:hypothetical protein
MNKKISYRLFIAISLSVILLSLNIITILNGNSNPFYKISCDFLPDNFSAKLPNCPNGLIS